MNDKGKATKRGSQVKWFCEKGPYVPPTPITTTSAPVKKVTPAPIPIATVTMTKPAMKPTPTPTPQPGMKCISPWGKCGGQGWNGATCCVHDYQCIEQGRWYSQCIPLPGHKWNDEDRGTRQSQQPAPTTALRTTSQHHTPPKSALGSTTKSNTVEQTKPPSFSWSPPDL